jgi:PHD/YefM family antitoxin component YafN of YafNO toxin-antitoxin module
MVARGTPAPKDPSTKEIIFKFDLFMIHLPRKVSLMPIDLRMNEIFPISDFVRNASEHTARIRLTKRAEILTQHGRPSLAVMPAEEYERLIAASDLMESIEAVKEGLEAAEAGRSKPAAEVIRAWEAL